MDERQIIEAALDCEDSSDAVWPAIAERIRAARELSGLSWEAVAEHLREAPSHFWDLELYDDELFRVVSVNTIGRLAGIFGITVDEVLFGIAAQPPAARTSFADVAARLSRLLASENLTVDDLGDRIGWDVSRVLADPESLGDYNVDGFRRVCNTIDVDWVTALPRPRDNAG